jgi:hypothetical protein
MLRVINSGDEVNPRAMLHRVGDQADFEQFDIGQLAASRIAGEAARAVAEAEAAGLALPQRLRRAPSLWPGICQFPKPKIGHNWWGQRDRVQQKRPRYSV